MAYGHGLLRDTEWGDGWDAWDWQQDDHMYHYGLEQSADAGLAKNEVATSLGFQGCSAEQVILCLPMNMRLYGLLFTWIRKPCSNLFNMLGHTQQTLFIIFIPRFEGTVANHVSLWCGRICRCWFYLQLIRFECICKYQVIVCDLFTPYSWRSLNLSKRSLNHPKKVTLNRLVYIFFSFKDGRDLQQLQL